MRCRGRGLFNYREQIRGESGIIYGQGLRLSLCDHLLHDRYYVQE